MVKQYRGRLDASRTTVVAGARRDLFEAMRQIAETGAGPAEQLPSMGCSITWRIDTNQDAQAVEHARSQPRRPAAAGLSFAHSR